ncbi:hypothetical protein NQZ68_018196 [Dissostichus eleginoides]|nr:hypothetical protein NQZ68_018196 [Dissostichus eleginoides]
MNVSPLKTTGWPHKDQNIRDCLVQESRPNSFDPLENEPEVNQERRGNSQKLPETSKALSPLSLGRS